MPQLTTSRLDTLIDLLGRDFVSMSDFRRIGRLATLVASAFGVTRDDLLAELTA